MILQAQNNTVLSVYINDIIFISSLMKTWSVNGTNSFSPLLICGIICFCKYLEFENEAIFL